MKIVKSTKAYVISKTGFYWVQLGFRKSFKLTIIGNFRFQSLSFSAFFSVSLGHPLFFSFLVILGRSVGKRKKNAKIKLKSCLELGGPVPHKVKLAAIEKGKSASLLESNENREKAKNL